MISEDDRSHQHENNIIPNSPQLHDDGTEITTESELNQFYQQQHESTPSVHGSTISSPIFKDCTDTVHHMHNLLLYLLSNPQEFQDAIDYYKEKCTTNTLSAFHDDFDRATDVGSVFHTGNGGDNESIPIPFMVFAPDSEVVLPQAHTASQLFGYERDVGIELEATNGILGSCQLFLRWLALMPGGDHMNLIEPPGLTVMRISGGRYRVTAAHRVVWTWNNEFLADPLTPHESMDQLHFGDLVQMTIVDVFETDCDGKLLSYCPTFDNRAITKTDETVERFRKGSSTIKKNMKAVAQSQTAAKVNQAASLLGKLSFKAAVTVKDTVQKKLDENRGKKEDQGSTTSPSDVKNVQAFELALDSAGKRPTMGEVPKSGGVKNETYISDDETTSVDER